MFYFLITQRSTHLLLKIDALPQGIMCYIDSSTNRHLRDHLHSQVYLLLTVRFGSGPSNHTIQVSSSPFSLQSRVKKRSTAFCAADNSLTFRVKA